jgi:hypothetical protein
MDRQVVILGLETWFFLVAKPLTTYSVASPLLCSLFWLISQRL